MGYCGYVAAPTGAAGMPTRLAFVTICWSLSDGERSGPQKEGIDNDARVAELHAQLAAVPPC